MQKRKNAGKSDSKFGRLDDEHVLELAEEVLGSSDDEIIILDDETDTASDESEDIIDLTDATDIPLDDEEDILDLTDELEDATDEDTDIFELQDISEQTEDTDDDILELDDTVEAFTDADVDDEIMTLEEEVVNDDATQEDIVDLDEAVAVDRNEDDESGETLESKEFSIETDTIELSEADRKALEDEFGFEPEKGLDLDTLDMSAPQALDEPQDPENPSEETHLEDTLELTGLYDTPENAAGTETAEADTDPIVELTDEDRTSLEEALKTEIFEDSEESMDEASMPEAEEAELKIDLPEDDALDTVASTSLDLEDAPDELAEPAEAEDASPGESVQLEMEASDAPEAEIRFDAPESESTETDEFGDLTGDWAAEAAAEDRASDEDELRLDFGDENAPAEPEPAEPETAPSEDEIRLDFQDDSQERQTHEVSEAADTDESPAPAELSDQEPENIEPVFDLDDEAALTPPEDATLEETESAASTEAPLETDAETLQPREEQSLAEDLGLDLEDSPATESPDLQVNIQSDDDALAQRSNSETHADEADTQAEDDFIESLGMTIETDMPTSETGDAFEETPSSGQDPSLSVDFEHTEDPDAADLHKTADNISIRVKEHAEDNYSDEDQLLSKVFQPESEAVDSSSLEETVERLVNKLFAEKIEAILVNAIERAVTQEIDRLKTALLGELNRRE